MEQKAVRLKYVMKKFMIDAKSINKLFVLEEERRLIRGGKVSQIRVMLEKGIHFDPPFVVNLVGDKYRILDGNHRLTAIQQILDKNDKFQIEVWLAEYKNLNTQEELVEIRKKERDIYTKWNKGTAETATDFIQNHFKAIPYGEMMLKQLPVAIYGSDKLMQLKVLIGAYIVAKKQTKFHGGFAVGGEKAVAELMKIEPQDIKVIKAFYLDMVEIFGEYRKGMPFYRPTPMYAFFRIWYDNRKTVPRDKFIHLFREIFAKRTHEWEELSKHGGRSASQQFYRLSIERLKDSAKRHNVLSDTDILGVSKKSQPVDMDEEVADDESELV